MVAGLIPDDVIGIFNLANPSSRTMALGSTQPLTEMSARNLPRCKGRLARKADNLTVICEPLVGASTSHNSMGLHRDSFTLFLPLQHSDSWFRVPQDP
jgi:hypothetical protein